MAQQSITLSKETELELLKFKNPRTAQPGERGASQQEYERLHDVLSSSHKMAQEVHLAITSRFPDNQAYMQGFFINDNLIGSDVAAAFSSRSKEIGFNPDTLNSKTREDYYYAVMTTAHELQHALDKVNETSILNALEQQIVQQNGIRDYTDEIQNWVLQQREWEARAEINGFNAVVEALREEIGGRTPTLGEIYNTSKYDMKNFIEETTNGNGQKIYSWRTHLTNPQMSFQPNADMTLDFNNATNRDVIASRFYDATYPNQIAAKTISFIIDKEKVIHGKNSKVHINMQTLAQHGITLTGLQNNGVDLKQIVDISSLSFLKSQQHAVQQHASNEKSVDDYVNRLLNKYAAIRTAYQSGDQESIREAHQNFVNQSPTAQATLARIQSEVAQHRQEKVREAQAYAWDKLPEGAQVLNQQIKQHLKTYYEEQNFPYTEWGLNNRAAALTAAAYENRIPKVDSVHINDADRKLVAVHRNFYGGVSIATADLDRSLILPERESFKQIMQTEQQFIQEAQQREYEKQMEREQSVGIRR